MAHARVGVPLSLYLESFGVLQCLILEAVLRKVEDGQQRDALMQLVIKLTTLDIALATEVYHRSQIQDLDRSLRHLELKQQDLRQQLEQDALTGVSSRTSLLHELQDAMARAAKTVPGLEEAHLRAWRASWGEQFPTMWQQHIRHLDEAA